jgi:hypothetical protein
MLRRVDFTGLRFTSIIFRGDRRHQKDHSETTVPGDYLGTIRCSPWPFAIMSRLRILAIGQHLREETGLARYVTQCWLGIGSQALWRD